MHRTTAARSEPRQRWSAGRRDLLGVVVVSVLFVLAVWTPITRPLGRSHDGFNTAVWMHGGRAIVDDGIVDSKLGAVGHSEEPYAHHPPGLYVISAVAYAFGGTRPVVAHLPGVISVLAGLALGWVLVRELGRSRLGAFAALSLVVAAPMTVLYGPMLNHESIALPWALAALLVVARAHHGTPVPTWAAAAVGFGGAILTWQGTLLVGLLAASLLVPAWRLPVAARRSVLALSLAAAAAVACTVAWQLWVYGGIGNVVDAFRFRVDGKSEETEFGFVEAQVKFLSRGFPLWTLALTALGLAYVWRDRVERLVIGALVAAVAGYALVFRQGATVHSYWNFWAVMVVVVAVAALVDHVAPRVAASPPARTLVVAGCIALTLVTGVVLDVRGEGDVALGARGGDVARRLVLPADQTTVFTMTTWDEPQPWVSYAVGLPDTLLVTAQEVEAVAAAEPDAVVLVERAALERLRPGTFDALTDRHLVNRDPYAAVEAADLAAALR